MGFYVKALSLHDFYEICINMTFLNERSRKEPKQRQKQWVTEIIATGGVCERPVAILSSSQW